MFKELLQGLEERITRISDQEYVPRRGSLEQGLVGLSRLYRKGVDLRLRAFASGIKKQHRLPCPVISIGNIVAGGAGKTPMAVFLADRLLALGRKPVVVSRGYKGRLGRQAAVVGDGTSVFLDARTAGDEPWMMARLRRFPVVAGRDRYTAGRLALDRLDVDTVILDDGFQHLALARDLDILLMDWHRPLGNGRMLPAGRLRETPEMCRDRVSCLVLTRSPEKSFLADDLAGRVPGVFSRVPVFASRHRPVLAHWKGAGWGGPPPQEWGGPDSPVPDPGSLSGRKALLFSGIARNDAFAESVRNLGIKVLDHLEFSDHYRYKGADFFAVRRRARALGADLVLTTEKDWVKVDPSFDFGRDTGAMGVAISLDGGGRFDELLTQTLARKGQ